MSRQSVVESLATTEETLFNKLEQLERRNNKLKRYPHIRDRVNGLEGLITKSKQLLGTDDASVALLYIRCLSLFEETRRILHADQGSTTSTTNSFNLSSFSRIQPIEMQTFQSTANTTTSEVQKTSNPWQKTNNTGEKSKNEQEKEDRDQYNYYAYHKSKWWRILCMNSAKEAKEKDSDVRQLWNTQIEFFLSCLGFIVGVGNIIRFPSMVYKHGGIFFVPYIVCLFTFGLPLVYMHLCIGQYSGLSASGAFWKMMPIASGIGWALVLLAVPVSIYYNIIVAWSLTYLSYSFQGILPNNDFPWGVCQKDYVADYQCCPLTLSSINSQNSTECYANEKAITATEAFFHFQVLNRSLLRNPVIGSIQMHMVVALAFAWILVFFGVVKGIGSIRWAVSITATIPYLILIVLLLRGWNLDGAYIGFDYLLDFKFERLLSMEIWRCAAEQVFYELGIDSGPLISMASFSRYRNNIYRDAVLLVLLNMFTSLLCSLVIFSFMGFLASKQDKPIDKILNNDCFYLSFTVYPGITSFMDPHSLWPALFFIMLTLSAIDAEFAWLEMIASAIMNQLRSKNKSIETRLLIGLCLFCFICGIPLCTQGGIFIFHAIEHFNANWNSFCLSLMQVIVICLVYGVDRFLKDIEEMLRVESLESKLALPGRRKWRIFYRRLKHFFGPTGGYIKFSWCAFAPFILTTLLLFSVFDNDKELTFNGKPLPPKYETIAQILMLGPLLVVPFTVGYTIYETRRRKKPLKSIISGENWRNKKMEPERQHKIDTKNDDYMYIDPISRGASAKSKINADEINNQPTNEDTYSRANQRIREFADRSPRIEPSRSFNSTSAATTINYNVDNYELGEHQAEELYGRRTGRLRDIPHFPPDMPPDTAEGTPAELSSSSELFSSEEEDSYAVQGGKRSTVKRSPLSKSAVLGLNKEPLQLFGPPPIQELPDVFAQSMSRINKNREQRRSDQRKNRVFNNSFNLIVVDRRGSSNSGDRMPSPSTSIPDRPEISEHGKQVGPRKSTESDTNISLSRMAPWASTESPVDDKDPFPMALSVPKLKRPKPIHNIPSSSKSDGN